MDLVSVNERKKILKDELRRMVDIIKVKYKPDKVILFGSFARGKVHKWSDIDLLIIKDTRQRPIDRCVRLARLVHPKVGVDLFIYTPKEYEFLLKEKFSLLMNILKEGKVLYEKRN
ncbi:MAG: nucleotidyltransferase domain-containing protein [Candidatus Omnitrophica bacterium]|nr:nucleotidyltransferase domain-containing protein [Candidatus Omnitrophota bacterium]